jgi:hypothetical protein
MRSTVLALTALGAIFAIDAAPAAAGNYPYCIKGCDYGSGLGDCSFATYQQCQATASGRIAYCAANPYFSQNAEVQPNRSSRRRY